MTGSSNSMEQAMGPDVSSGMDGMMPGGAGGGGGSSAAARLGSMLKDPEVLKALGSFGSKLGSAMGAAHKIPPHVQAMIAQAVQEHGASQRAGLGGGSSNSPYQYDSVNPYGGDMTRFITPEMAKGVLDNMGIPYGRMRPLS